MENLLREVVACDKTEGTLPGYVFGYAGECSYCGGVGNTMDHVIPCAYFCENKRRRGSGIRTPSCCECNSLLGDRVFQSFAERGLFIHDRLRIRYDRLLRGPAWDCLELARLGKNMRSRVRSQMAKREYVLRRLEWYDEGFVLVMRDARDMYDLRGSSWPGLRGFFYAEAQTTI